MEYLPKEIHIGIINLCGITEMFILCFVSKKYKQFFEKCVKKYNNNQIHPKIFTNISTVGLMKWYYNLYCHLFCNNRYSWLTNKSGDLEVYTWLIENNKSEHVNIPICAEKGHYDLLFKLNVEAYANVWEIDSYGLIECEPGNYELLCWMMDNNMKIPYNDITFSILTGGGYELFLIRECSGSTGGFIPLSKPFKYRNVSCDRLRQFYKKSDDILGGSMEYITISAVSANNINALNFLNEIGILSKEDAFHYGLGYNSINVIRWLIEIINYDKIIVPKYFSGFTINYKLLKYLHNHGLLLTNECYSMVIDDLKAIQYLSNNNIPFPKAPHLDISLMQTNNIEIVDWFRENGYHLDEDMINLSKSVEMLKYLENKGYIVAGICSYGCKLDMIKYLASNNYKLSNDFYSNAIEYGSPEIIKWVKKHHDKIELLQIK
jgi:hypothetical protein